MYLRNFRNLCSNEICNFLKRIIKSYNKKYSTIEQNLRTPLKKNLDTPLVSSTKWFTENVIPITYIVTAEKLQLVNHIVVLF